MITKIQLFIFLFMVLPWASAITPPSHILIEEEKSITNPMDIVTPEDEWGNLLKEYRVLSSEKEIMFSTVSVSTQDGTCMGFFIGPNTIVTSYLAIGGVVDTSPIEDIQIIDFFGKTKSVSRILYIDSYHDLVVLELDNHSSDYFLSLSEEDSLTLEDELMLLGYFYQPQEDGIPMRHPLSFKGKVIEAKKDYYTIRFNFYKLHGLCGAPVLDKRTGKVKGIFSTVIANNVGIRPVKELFRVIKQQDFCENTTICLNQVQHNLNNRVTQNQSFAQFVLGTLYYMDYQLLFEKMEGDQGQEVEKNDIEEVEKKGVKDKKDIETMVFSLNQALSLYWLAGQGGYNISLHNLYSASVDVFCGFEYKAGFENKETCDLVLQELHAFVKETNYSPTTYYLGFLYLAVQQDEEQAEAYFLRAGETGYALAEIELAEMYFKRFLDLGGEENRLKAVLWNERASKNGWFQSKKRLRFLKSQATH